MEASLTRPLFLIELEEIEFIITPELTEPLCVKNCIYVISVINCFFFYVSVNYMKHIFTSKNKKNEIVIYVHEDMI